MTDPLSEPLSTASQQAVIVAGCGNEIAAAVVRRLIRRGDRVLIWGGDPGPLAIDLEPAVGTAEAVEKPLSYVAGEEFQQAVDAALDRGRIGALINFQPVVGADEAIGEAIDALYSRILQVTPHMRSGGQIVNIMSSAGRYRTGYFRSSADADQSQGARAGMDGAIFGLTRQLGFELAPRRIRVNAVSLGWIRSGERDREWDAMTAREREFLLEEISIGRPGEPDEVAAAVEFLASDASSYVTCNAIDVNGGWWTS